MIFFYYFTGIRNTPIPIFPSFSKVISLVLRGEGLKQASISCGVEGTQRNISTSVQGDVGVCSVLESALLTDTVSIGISCCMPRSVLYSLQKPRPFPSSQKGVSVLSRQHQEVRRLHVSEQGQSHRGYAEYREGCCTSGLCLSRNKTSTRSCLAAR